MSTKTITITEEAYERLKARKEENESFSEVIVRITKKSDIMDFAGFLTEKEADELGKNIKESRKHSAARADRIKKRLSE